MMSQTQLTRFPDAQSIRCFVLNRLRILGLCLVIIANVPSVDGQETNPSGTRVGTQIQQSDLATQPISNNVQFVSEMLSKELKKDHDVVGKVDDVAFDLETEHLALIVASNGTSDESKRYALLPFDSGDRLIQFGWEKTLTLQTKPTSIVRSRAAELYRDYKQVVYWNDFVTKKLTDSKEVFDDKEFSLTYYSTLDGWPVVDNGGTPIGKVGDLAVRSSNGEILYVVMLSNDSELRAIPLGAFVNDDVANRWSIDLKSEQIFKFKPFQAKFRPTGVDRGWEEYVAVKYGRGGLQASKKIK